MTDTTSQQQGSQCSVPFLSRPPVPPECHSARLIRSEESHVLQPPQKPPPQAPQGNKETRCHKQWTINPWSRRKELQSKSNFFLFLFLFGIRGKGDLSLRTYSYEQSSVHLSAPTNILLKVKLSRTAPDRCEFLFLRGTRSSSRPSLHNWSDFYFVQTAAKTHWYV